MRALLDKLMRNKTQTSLDYSSVMVVYQVDKDTWRGFVLPFDITFESGTRDEVVTVLRDMTSSYVEGLREYKSPEHLANVPLSYEPDLHKFQDISGDLMNKLLNKVSRIESIDYYAEAQQPA